MKRSSAKKMSVSAKTPDPDKARQSSAAYGGTTPICINTDCTLRKKAGGCFGFEGCPGFKSR
ncbi:MAG: hypothetical protein FIA94_02095 [Nitrospirae bacterium]|nr:hypothetical protein [Nitrospirota bacterium]